MGTDRAPSAGRQGFADILTAAVELLDKVSKHDDGVTRFAYQMRDLLGRVVERLASASSEEPVRAMCEVCGERPAKHVAAEAANMLMCAECLAAVAEPSPKTTCGTCGGAGTVSHGAQQMPGYPPVIGVHMAPCPACNPKVSFCGEADRQKLAEEAERLRNMLPSPEPQRAGLPCHWPGCDGAISDDSHYCVRCNRPVNLPPSPEPQRASAGLVEASAALLTWHNNHADTAPDELLDLLRELNNVLAAEKAREPDGRDAEIERLRRGRDLAVEIATGNLRWSKEQQEAADLALDDMLERAEQAEAALAEVRSALTERDAVIERMRKDLEREARDRIDLATALGGKMQPTKSPGNEELEHDLNAMRAFLREHRKANEDRAAGIGVFSRAFAAICRQVLDLLQETPPADGQRAQQRP